MQRFWWMGSFNQIAPKDGAMNKLAIVVASMLSLSVVAVGVYTWISLGDVAMTTSGYVALALGAVVTAAVGIVLMVLLFYSSRKGFDDRAAGATRPEERQGR